MSRAPLDSRAAPAFGALSLAATAALLGGCVLTSSSSQGPSAQPSAARPSDSQPSSWLAQAWESWQRAQKTPLEKPSPAPKLALGAPAPLRPALLASLDLAPDILPLPLSSASILLPGFASAPISGTPAGFGSAAFGGTDALWRRALRGFEAGLSSASLPRGGAVTSTWRPLQDEIEARQVQAIQSLALRVALQRRTASQDRESLLRADLDDDLERVGRVDLGGLVPALPPRDRLEKLTNLRLKLLEALAIPASEQERAQAEIARIENEIRALLREQEVERAELLERLRREVPARLRAQREADIQRLLGQAQSEDSSAIAGLLTEQKQRAQVDFSAPARLVLAAPAPISGAGTSQKPGAVGFDKNQFRTFVAASPSSGAIRAPQVQPQVLAAPPERAQGLGSEQAPSAVTAFSGSQQGRWQALLSKRARDWRLPLR